MDLRSISLKVEAALTSRARVIWQASTIARVIVLVGALVATVAAAMGVSAGASLGWQQIFGILGAILAFFGGLFLLAMERDSSQELEMARSALDEAREAQYDQIEILNDLKEYDHAVERLTALYLIHSIARGVVEQAVVAERTDVSALINACLSTCARQMCIALDFEIRETWTICVYQALASDGDGPNELKCIATRRSVECDIKNARVWREGVGVGGLAYAKNDEVVVPDLNDPAVAAILRLEKDKMKDEDRERYRSIFAVPVSVGSDARPWGVVLATSDVVGHFGNEDNLGVDPEEAVRALAGVVALAVSVCRSNYSSTPLLGKGRTENEGENHQEG